MDEKNNKKQIENPILNKIKNTEKEPSFLDLPEDEAPDNIIIGTNPLLWSAPTYSAIGIDLDKEDIENPNAYWEKWAAEQEAKQRKN